MAEFALDDEFSEENDPVSGPGPDEELLLNAIDAFEERSYGGEQDGELQSQRALSIEYYLGNNVEPSPAGRSQIVDRSVFEAVQWILPSLSRIFTAGDNVVEFEPLGPDDEQSAQQESDFLNYLVTQKNPWFKIITTWFQDALTTKNAYCYAFIDEKVKTERERYEDQSELQITHLLEGEGVEVVAFSAKPDEDQEPQPVMAQDEFGQPIIHPETGQPMPVVDENGVIVTQPVMVHDIEIRRVTPEKKLCFKVLPPERCKVAEVTPDHTLEECPYFEYWDRQTISDLRAAGFDVDDHIASDDEAETEEDDARDTYHETYASDSETPLDPAMRRVKVRTVWIRHDYDGDGISELQRVIVVGREILDRREESRIPVASIVPFLLTHRHIGLSLVDVVGDIQRIMTAILRQGLDNLYISQNPRPFVNEDKVNLDDVLISRPGQPVRSMPGQHPVLGQDFGYLEVPQIFPHAMAGLEYMDTVKEKRTGINKSFSGADPQSLQNHAQGTVSQLSTMAGQRVEQIARIFSEGVEHLFSIAHELLLKHGHKREVMRLRGQWVDIDPSTWKTGRDLRISVTYGAGNKDAMAARLSNLIDRQIAAAQAGYRIVSEQDVYEAHMELAKAGDLPEKFFTDPATAGPNGSPLPPPEKPPNPVLIAAQVEQQKLDSNERIKGVELDQKQMESDQDTAIKRYEVDRRTELQLAIAQLNAGKDVDVAKLRINGRQGPSTTLKIDGNQELKKAADTVTSMAQSNSEQTKEIISAISAAFEGLSKSMGAPREVVRDSKGRVTGTRIVS